MTEPDHDVRRALRFIASGGWADEDPETVAELLEQASRMATLILADAEASAQLRAAAQDFLDRLRSDTFGAG